MLNIRTQAFLITLQIIVNCAIHEVTKIAIRMWQLEQSPVKSYAMVAPRQTLTTVFPGPLVLSTLAFRTGPLAAGVLSSGAI
jgi:hypothetical protein